LRLFSFGGYGLALAALALVVFGAIECPPALLQYLKNITFSRSLNSIFGRCEDNEQVLPRKKIFVML